MRNVALILSYDGRTFHGWQIQPHVNTVQGLLTRAIYKLTCENIYLSGCGRTDAGVHARNYVANFKTNCTIPENRLPVAINSQLDDYIAVRRAIICPDDFDSRFSCIKKQYCYEIYCSDVRDVFHTGARYFCRGQLDISSMQSAARHFIGTHDFESMRNQGTPVRCTVRTIYDCHVDTYFEQGRQIIKIYVRGNGFLYNMVRNIAGTLLYVGQGKIYPHEIKDILQSRDRCNGGVTLCAEGLYLDRLWYDFKELQEGLESESTSER